MCVYVRVHVCMYVECSVMCSWIVSQWYLYLIVIIVIIDLSFCCYSDVILIYKNIVKFIVQLIVAIHVMHCVHSVPK